MEFRENYVLFLFNKTKNIYYWLTIFTFFSYTDVNFLKHSLLWATVDT